MSQPTRKCPICHTPLPGMAAFCYVCGTATPTGIDRATGERVAISAKSGITEDDLLHRLQRALGPGYQIEERIGSGGFAVVYKVRDLRLKRHLAVKVLRPDLGLSVDILQRFRREAETVAALRHTNIVSIYDVGEAEGLAFLIMPLVSGESLRATMDREGAMPLNEVRRILREAASGLAAAHDAGVIHRDIKPENIMLDGKDRHALLMDFGIAKAISNDDANPGEALTTTGIIIGTPQYMSPEQATGDKSIDARTDQYSLAVVGYRMLCGKLPFDGESTRAVLYQQLVADPQPLESRMDNIPISLAAAIQKAMAKEPNERFTDMREFAAALAESEHSTLTAAPASAGKKKAPSRAPIWVGVAALLVVTAGLAASGVFAGPEAPPAVPPDSLGLLAPFGSSTNAGGSTGVQLGALPSATTPQPPPPPATPAGNTAATRAGRGTTPAPGAKNATNVTTVAPPASSPATPAASSATCVKLVGDADWTAAVPLCIREAEGGSVVSQRLLAGLYDKGTGVPEDAAKAVEWYRKAAGSDPEAKFRLSVLLEAGRGVAKNQAEGIVYLREAAGAGYLQAQLLLAKRLEAGTNIKQDEKEAAVWYRRLAERGDRTSEEKLAEFLAKGRGVTKNETEALEWYRKAAEAGSMTAAWTASQMYFKGQGTAKSDAEGMTWLRKAAEGNHAEAVKELKKRGG